MNHKIFFITLAALLVIEYAHAGLIRNIDNFTPDQYYPLVASTDSYTQDVFVTDSSNGDDTLGVERDQNLFLQAGTPFKVVSITINSGEWTLGWDQSTIGFATLQFDGVDGSSDLNLVPGLQQYDLTETGGAVAFILDISTDHPAAYSIDVYGSTTSIHSTYAFTANPTLQSVAFDRYYIPFTKFTGNANFKQINGIELTLDVTAAIASNAIDTSVLTFATFGYQISGNVYLDCNANGIVDINESFFQGANVTLTNSAGTTLLQSKVSDVNGAFTFFGLNNGTYNVCVTSPGTTATVPSTGCRKVTVGNFTDATGLLYGLSVQTTVVAPPSVTLPCGSCTAGTPECTGVASVTGCGTTNPVPFFNDTVTSSVCPKKITRTWGAPGTTSTSKQTITLTDTVPPTITVAAQSVSVDCLTPSITMSAWVAGVASAQASDCNGFSWTNNWNGVAPTSCATRGVTFTATDPCGNKSNTTATYTVVDDTNPTFTTLPVSTTVQCNKNGTDIAAFNAWLAADGYSVATDDCTPSKSIVFTNDYVSGLTTGCFSSVTVGFTATDACGNTAFATAAFTIQDTRKPTITTAAKGSSAECTGTGTNPAFTAWLNSHAGAVASDTCTSTASIVWTNNFDGESPNSCNTAITVVFFATDICGQTANTSAAFTITDTTPPKIFTPAASLTFPCDTEGLPSLFNNWLSTQGGAFANDSCTVDVNWTNSVGTVPSSFCGVATVTFTASDLCNPPRSAQTTASFTVTDTVKPVYLTAPQNFTTNCGGNTAGDFNNWLNTQGGAVITDNCSTNITLSNNNGGKGVPTGCNGSSKVTFTAADQCGNKASATATFKVTDSTAPTFDNDVSDSTVECSTTSRNAYVTWLNSNAGATVFDDCNPFTIASNGPASINNGCFVQQTVTFTATDSCGNANAETATFTIQDTTDPVITKQATDKTVQCDGTSSNTTLTNWLKTRGGANATDSCGKVTWTNDFEGLSGEGCTSSALVTFTASDACGNFATTAATYTVTDSSLPIITKQAQPQTVQCDGYGNQQAFNDWLDSHGGATATDTCVGAESLSWTNNFGEGDLFTCGTSTVTFTVSDPCGNSAATTASFTVFDNIAPTFSPSAQDLTVECDGYGNTFDYNDWVDSNGGAVPSDACALFLTVTNTAPATGPVGCGAVTVTFTATDDCNNSGRTTATYRVADTTAPAILDGAEDQSVECDSTANPGQISAWLADNGGAFAVDACTSVFWSNNYVGLVKISGCASTATVTFTVSDQCSNSALTAASFSVVDTTPPTLLTPAEDITIQCSEFSHSQIVTWLATNGGATATDSCTVVRWSNDFDPTSEEDSCDTPIPVTFTASDLCGNFVQTFATLTLTDTTPPIFVNFPEDLELNCDQCSTAECLGIPIAADACTSNIDVTWTDEVTTGPTILLCPGNQNIVRTFHASDACGNTVDKEQTIVVNIARTAGPCNPDECPPCNTTQSCCTSTVPQVACNPVTCNAVACNPVPCLRVPCTPVTAEDCVQDPTGTYIPPLPYGGGFGNNYECEPIYIYIFDDDDNVQNGDVNYEYVYVEVHNASANDAPRISLPSTLFLVVLTIFALF